MSLTPPSQQTETSRMPIADLPATPREEERDKLKALTDEYLNGWKRALADYENYKKSSEKRLNEWKIQTRAELIASILPIMEHFDEALRHVPTNLRLSPWYQGLVQTRQQWTAFLALQEIVQIECVGKKFDPHLHEAIEIRNEENKSDGEIISVRSNGYTMDGILLKPAQVIVNKLITK